MSALSSRSEPESIIARMLDQLVSLEEVQSNCMFQLSLMLARISLEQCSEAYKEETSQALLALIRGKPRTNLISLFAVGASGGAENFPRTPNSV